MTLLDGGDSLEALAELPTIAHPTASPDGEAVALYYDGTGRNELHVVDVETGTLTQWSDGEVPGDPRWHVEWSADGDRVFFHRDEAGDEQNDVYAIDAEGRVEPVVRMDGQVTVEDVGADGRTLLLGGTRDGQRNLYCHDLRTGETTKLTEYERPVRNAELSPDCEHVAYATNETADFENLDVYVAAADGSDPRVLPIGETGAETVPVDWGPGGNRLLVADNSADLMRSAVYDLETGGVHWFGSGYEEEPHCFLPDGERVVALRTREATTLPVVYDVGGRGEEPVYLPEGVSSFGRTATLGDDRLLLTHTTPTQRPEVLVYDLATKEASTVLGAEYGPFSPSDFAEAEYVTVESDGVPATRQAAVEHEPAASLEIGALLYDSGARPSPLVVTPHGGPRTMNTKAFDRYAQFLVQQGYSVLQVNYRGSSGRGRSFVRELYDDRGGAEQGDVATVTEHVVAERIWIDPDRVAVFGASYGGDSTYWQLVQYPDLYDAGVAWTGLTDRPRMYETTMPHYRTELLEKTLETPADTPDQYRERSPVDYVSNLSAPLLVLHDVTDRGVPGSQARRFRRALDTYGYTEAEEGDYEYVELGGESHVPSDVEQKKRRFRLLADFLDRRL
ncbi:MULTISPECIES: S9 family peptidase [Haloarcula]|uniref:S9 family peptidase n=1 Tax=Haloarcula TaxID=2237 RepID=UPI0023ED615D|nr:prolyl oligopeptidase family serine peptidase [Halomicroarcula sp. XH51]